MLPGHQWEHQIWFAYLSIATAHKRTSDKGTSVGEAGRENENGMRQWRGGWVQQQHWILRPFLDLILQPQSTHMCTNDIADVGLSRSLHAVKAYPWVRKYIFLRQRKPLGLPPPQRMQREPFWYACFRSGEDKLGWDSSWRMTSF